MHNIKDYTLADLSVLLASEGEPPFRAKQLFGWLYQRGITDFAQMSNVGKALRAKLAEHFTLGGLEVARVQTATDGTRKFAFRLHDGNEIESVLMPNRTHHTLCVSSQVGCAMGCDFCQTARMGLVRHLSAGEIVQQVVEAARHTDPGLFIRNVVFMGMGEPLHNYPNLARAIAILTEDHGFGFSARRLTVSTSGLVPAIRRFAAEGVRAQLAVSLNGVTDEMRARLMPVTRRWPIAEVLEACRSFPADYRHRITFEYVLLKGITDDLGNAKRLVRLLHGIRCKVNLIPYNPGPGSKYEAPNLEHCQAFQTELLERGMLATLRLSKGQDIQAACGQLAAPGRAAPPRRFTAAEAHA